MTMTVGHGFLLASGTATKEENYHLHEHSVQFYDGEAYLLGELSPYVGGALKNGYAAIVIATAEHRSLLAERLALDEIDIESAEAAGLYIALDAGNTLARFMRGDLPDPRLFAETIGGVLTRARVATGPLGRIVAFGEMVALLYAEGHAGAAIRLEQLWNELSEVHSFELRCAYPIHAFTRESDGHAMGEICAEHCRVLPTEGYAAVQPDDRGRVIALLQQKARALEYEVAERKRVEEALAERNSQLAEAVVIREAFLSIAAHELKTPLTGVRLSAQLVQRLLRAGSDGAERVGVALDRLDAQTAKLACLVDRLLDVSRLQQGQLVLDPVEANVGSIVQTRG